MKQNTEEKKIIDYYQDTKDFADYLGIDYDDYVDFFRSDVDFDDVSR